MSNNANQPRELGPIESLALLDEGGYLLDVRELDEWEAGHAPQASHIPLGQLQQRRGELPLDRTIVCVCRSGGRSAAAAGLLGGDGLDAVNLAGGMRAWASSDLPVIDASGGSGTVI